MTNRWKLRANKETFADLPLNPVQKETHVCCEHGNIILCFYRCDPVWWSNLEVSAWTLHVLLSRIRLSSDEKSAGIHRFMHHDLYDILASCRQTTEITGKRDGKYCLCCGLLKTEGLAYPREFAPRNSTLKYGSYSCCNLATKPMKQ